MSGCFYDYSAYGYLSQIAKTRTHAQSLCPDCGLWTVWTDKKTGEVSKDCKNEVSCPNQP